MLFTTAKDSKLYFKQECLGNFKKIGSKLKCQGNWEKKNIKTSNWDAWEIKTVIIANIITSNTAAQYKKANPV